MSGRLGKSHLKGLTGDEIAYVKWADQWSNGKYSDPEQTPLWFLEEGQRLGQALDGDDTPMPEAISELFSAWNREHGGEDEPYETFADLARMIDITALVDIEDGRYLDADKPENMETAQRLSRERNFPDIPESRRPKPIPDREERSPDDWTPEEKAMYGMGFDPDSDSDREAFRKFATLPENTVLYPGAIIDTSGPRARRIQ